jgi:hypothetical protein
MNGRVQDAITGRFLSADPYITEPGNTQNYNRYSYVYNNPMSYTDSSGFRCELENSASPQSNDHTCNDYDTTTGGDSKSDGGKGGGPDVPSIPTIIGHDEDGIPIMSDAIVNYQQWLGSFDSYVQAANFASALSFAGLSLDGGTSSGDMRSKSSVKKTPKQPPCTGIAGGIVDLTGGESGQSFVDDVVNNFVDVKDNGASTVAEVGASLLGGGTAANAYGGLTAGALAAQAWKDYRGPFTMTGIGFRSFSSAFATAGATWAFNSVLIKGMYNSGVLVGSVLRTGINRVASATCNRGQ